MKKEYEIRYPTIELDQRDLNHALTSMLNCRRYLSNQGFKEKLSMDYSHAEINTIAGDRGIIVFPDGSEINDDAFIKANSRDSLIERMISKEAIFIHFCGYEEYERNRVLRTTFIGNFYYFKLSIIDTTKEKAGFPLKLFKSKPEKFANRVYMALDKQIITDLDLEEFEEYRLGLEDVSKQETLLNYNPAKPAKEHLHTEKHNPKKVKIESSPKPNFINIWDIDIPKIEKGRKNE